MGMLKETIQVLVVKQTFKVNTLPSHLGHLECYTLINMGLVLIEGKGKAPIFVFFNKKAGKIVCHCSHAKLLGDCIHQQALLNGLWAKLTAISKNKSLLTHTRDWCEATALPTRPLPFAVPSQVAFGY